MQTELEAEEKQTTFEELLEELPEDSPIYPFFEIYTFQELKDGRVKYPLVLIHYSPPGVSHELNMLFSTTRSNFMKETGLNRALELQDKEEFDLDWVCEKLNI
ncbi:actin depolymerizing protein [Neoconidiobolus thromboides FSU 785]|nr:actin depolymerizing protein [Neoconidiobolus thromboides FSU 785]